MGRISKSGKTDAAKKIIKSSIIWYRQFEVKGLEEQFEEAFKLEVKDERKERLKEIEREKQYACQICSGVVEAKNKCPFICNTDNPVLYLNHFNKNDRDFITSIISGGYEGYTGHYSHGNCHVGCMQLYMQHWEQNGQPNCKCVEGNYCPFPLTPFWKRYIMAIDPEDNTKAKNGKDIEQYLDEDMEDDEDE